MVTYINKAQGLLAIMLSMSMYSYSQEYEKQTDNSLKGDSLSEVVVVGYGTQTRQQLTKSISSIGSKDVEFLAPVSTSVQDILGSGLAKGVMFTQNSGEPGSSPTINVRGITSPYPNYTTGTINNAPLYVIDGIPMFVEATDINPLLNLSPNDIESIDILKDAAATAIYGSRGANGVIMIKTKEGKRNTKPVVNFGYTFSIANPIKYNDVLNNEEFRTLHTDMIKNGINAYNNGYVWDASALNYFADIEEYGENEWTGMPLYRFKSLLPNAFGSESINWEKAISNSNAMSHQYNLSVKGGTDKLVYSFSLHGNNKEGLYKHDQMDIYGGRMSIASDINKYVRIGLTANYSETSRKFAITDNVMWCTRVMATRPDFSIYANDGSLNMIDEIGMFGGSGLFSPNPVAMLEQKNNVENSQFLGNVFAEFRIMDGLKFRIDGGHTNYKFSSSYFLPVIAQQDMSLWGVPTYSSLQTTESKYKTTTLNFQIDYKKDWENHSLQALVGYGTERTRNVITGLSYEDFPNDEILNNVSSARYIYGQTEMVQKNGLNSWFARANYGYLGKYYGEISFRADASSKFGVNNKWGYFPALSAGWIINKENFLKNYSWIDNLKLRASIGQTGSTNIDDFSYKQYYTAEGQYNGSSAIVMNNLLPNKNIRWEKTTEYNLGLDFAFLNHRLYGNIDVYSRKTDGALSPAPFILESGMSTYYDNIIDLSNKGFELSIGADVIRNRNFTWSTMLNISSNKCTIDKLNNASIDASMQDAFVEGYPVGTVKGYLVDHIIQNQSEIDELNEISYEKYESEYQSNVGVGDYLFKDIDGNGIIDEDDRTVIANPQAKFFGSFYNRLSYKNFSLSFILSFSYGGQAVYSQLQEDAASLLGHSVTREMYGNYWTPENPNAKYAQLAAFLYNTNTEMNDRYVFSTSYMRMKNVTLSYQLPKNVLGKLHISSANVFVTANNLFTISNWPGVDPETVTAGAAFMGRNNDPYPLSRSFSMGINLEF